ncbi:alanine racemase [Lachnospiraceae bacterium C1.1]|nr:alanine racemase [Lachnospiraceae bacterium C1.1]
MGKYERVCATVDLDALHFNLESMKNNLAAGTKIMAVIKTNAYGHGAVQIAGEIEKTDYVYGFATATFEEAMELRSNGIAKPVLVLGYTFPESYEEMVKNDIRPAVFRLDQAEGFSEAAVNVGKKVYFHLAVDTAMSRIGVRPDEGSVQTVKTMAELPNVEMEGIFTHFSKADMKGRDNTLEQIRKFRNFVDMLKKNRIEFKIHHCSNSAGIVQYKEANMDMVRAGITLYGLWPSDEVRRDIIDLKPLLALKSHIVYIKYIEPGEAVSYGGTYTAESRRRVATIPVGYGDGYPRSLSNKGYVIIRGKKAPILGRVCMDQFMVDVTDIKDAAEGDEVTLIGKDGNEELSMELMGDLSGRFNYELACDLGRRIPRIYIKDGKAVEIRDEFSNVI